MFLSLYHFLARLIRLLPKHKQIRRLDMQAHFFVPINCHYICDDLRQIEKGKREPELYQWLNHLPDHAVLFDIGTSYGQEASLASSFEDKDIKVVGFDCNLYHSHFCCLNKALNKDRFRFIFAAVAATSGKTIHIKTNSDTHIPQLHKKNAPYSYEVMSLALDDFAKSEKLYPTHLKIDVDGAEYDVLKGAERVLSNPGLSEIFIEIDHKNDEIIQMLEGYGFEINWREDKDMNSDMLFKRPPSST